MNIEINTSNDNKAIFIFCIPYLMWKRFLISRNAKIKDLNKALNIQIENYILIYDNCIVDQNSTFGSLVASEEKVLFAFQYQYNQMKSNLCSKLIKLSSDITFIRKMKFFSNKDRKNAFDRVSDSKYFKIEGSHRLYKKELHKQYIKNYNESSEETNEHSLSINFQPLIEPCSEALPILW